MDESYLEWLVSTGKLDREKAKDIAKKFPTLRDLATATLESIEEKTGLSLDEARSLKQKALESHGIDDKWYKKESSLFLCPECGSFVSIEAKSCPKCGSSFEEAAEEEPRELEDLEKILAKTAEESPELYMCSNCGAFLAKDSKKCPTCGQEITEYEVTEEELPIEVAADVEESEFNICLHCGAFLAVDAKKCDVCGKPVEEELIEKELEIPELKEPRGVSKDFLARWQRIAEKAPSKRKKLEEELRHYDELLKVDPRLERAWVLKYQVLRELGRPREAARCLVKAAQVNPEKEEEYKLQVLNLAEILADSSIIPPRWSAITPIEKPPVEISGVRKALAFYDRLLRIDPNLDVAWETRAELLKRLGKDHEAQFSLEKAKQARQAQEESSRKAIIGLKTASLPQARQRIKEGRVNGLVNGLVNGIGRVNGLVNGLVSGASHVNGLALDVGRVNGLINGNGFTNGRMGRFRPSYRVSRGGIRSIVGVAGAVLLLLALPMVASLIAPTPSELPFRIDGSFSDWQGVPERPDSLLDTKGAEIGLSYVPDLDLVATKIAEQDGQLVLYTRVNGMLFSTPETPPTSTSIRHIIALIDADGKNSTGYSIGDIGADIQVRLTGWNGTIKYKSLLSWRPELGGGSNNFTAFKHKTNVPAAMKNSELEFIVPIFDTQKARVLFMTANTTGSIDTSDSIGNVHLGTVVVNQNTVVSDITTETIVHFLTVNLYSETTATTIERVNVSKLGSISDQSVNLRLYQDDGDSFYSPSDTILDVSNISSGKASFDVNLNLLSGEQLTLFVVADITGGQDSQSLILRVIEVEGDFLADMRNAKISGTYFNQAPTIKIDGAFGDWDKSKLQKDAQWDVRSVRGSPYVNQNIDIDETGYNVTSDFSFYVSVHGSMLGGEDLPNLVQRPLETGIFDMDRDTVPDIEDIYPYDFDNDGIPDDTTNNDVDSDGLTDYPFGLDFWLNTTIPGNFPPPYAGRIVSIYIGPLSYNIPTGVDRAFAYIDSDNSSSTGLITYLDGNLYGIDYALVASGRNGVLENASLYRYELNAKIPFSWVSDIQAAIDSSRLEIAVNASSLNLMSGFQVLAFATDWMRDQDYSAPVITRGQSDGLRSPAGDNVVLNEIVPRKPTAWVELANPTSSSISLSGWSIQLVKGNKFVTLYSFTTEIIGAWLSGSEYLSVNVNPKDLPKANGEIVLRDSSGTIVDRFSYSAVGNGQSYARFKNATDGKPVDTDGGSDWYQSDFPSSNNPNDRRRPIIVIAKTVGSGTAQPGAYVTYTIYYNNTGDGRSNRVWINDTLPANVLFQSSSIPPTSSSGRTYRWIFNNVNPSTSNSFTVTVRVTANATDGGSEVNTVFGNYTDQLNRKMSSSTAWANFTVVRPEIVVEKTVLPSIANPGDIVTFTIYYNNTGSINAGIVWINDTLPVGVTFMGSSVPPASSSGQTYRWVFVNVAPGSHSFTITAMVDFNAPSSILVNWVFLNYTSANGYKLVGSSDSATLFIPEFHEIIIPIAIPLFIVIGRRILKKRKERSAVADSVPSTRGR